MARRTQHLLLAVILSGGFVAGCSSQAAAPRKPEQIEKKSGAAATGPQVARTAKPAPRETGSSTFNDPDYGISFRYPRNFALDEGAPDGISGVRSQEDLAAEEPGAELVATVAVPDDAYPNTNFAGGSLQFAVNHYLTARGCHDALAARVGDASQPQGSATIAGVPFAWAEGDAGDAGTEFFERDYAGFANGTCYEFFLRVGVGSPADQDSVRPANEKKILSNLEKIVESLQLQPKPVSVLDK
jgi:hypothetical protein